MTRRLLAPVALVGFLLAAWLAAPLVTAQAPAPSTPSRGAAKPWKVPRTADGKPDLQGFWNNTSYMPLERPKNVTKEFYTPEEAGEGEQSGGADRDRADRARNRSRQYTTTSRSSGWTAARAPVAPNLHTSMIYHATGRHPPDDRGRKEESRRARRGAKTSGHHYDAAQNFALRSAASPWSASGRR